MNPIASYRDSNPGLLAWKPSLFVGCLFFFGGGGLVWVFFVVFFCWFFFFCRPEVYRVPRPRIRSKPQFRPKPQLRLHWAFNPLCWVKD